MQREPSTKTAILPSAGVGYFFATRHRYSRTVPEPDPQYGDLRPQYRHMFRCEVTGVERPWGLEGDPTPGGER